MNPLEMVKAFNEFRANFKGNPQQEVERLVREGRIDQAQLNQLMATAKELQALFNSTK